MATNDTTRRLLTCGVAAGPLYLEVGLAQALTRPGFDLTRHDLSLLANGSLGWIQICNFLASGALTIAAAAGLRRAGAASKWAARLISAYGIGLLGAGIFIADPAMGFPPGTPADADAVSWHGLLHLACGGLGFMALIVACFIAARHFARARERAWAGYSAATGAIFFLSFAGIACGSGSSTTVIGFWIGVALAWSWIAAMSARALSGLRSSAEGRLTAAAAA